MAPSQRELPTKLGEGVFKPPFEEGSVNTVFRRLMKLHFHLSFSKQERQGAPQIEGADVLCVRQGHNRGATQYFAA